MFFIGVDLGQRQDYTAIAVVERQDVMRAFMPPSGSESLWVRHAERVPLGTPYPKVVEGIQRIVRHPQMAGRCSLAVDGTGVGAPVVDMLRSARLGCELNEVTITGGDRQHIYSGLAGTAYSVPKQDLIAGLQVLLDREQLKMALSLREKNSLIKELMDVQTTPGRSGALRFAAEGSGQHDDMVIALALACWRANRRNVGPVNKPLPCVY